MEKANHYFDQSLIHHFFKNLTNHSGLLMLMFYAYQVMVKFNFIFQFSLF